jgi:hypothetical protein
MRKIVLIISELIFFAVAFIACFDEKDFEFDKFTLKNLEPTLHLPLVNDTIRLSANNDYNVFYDKDGVGYLSFPVESDGIIPDVKEFFKVEDASSTLTNISFSLPGNGSEVFTTDPQSYSTAFPFSDDQQIDNITFKAGTLTFNMPESGSYTIGIPELKKGGASFTANIPGATAYDLSEYTLNMEAGNSFTVEMTLSIQSSESVINFDAGMKFSGIEIKEAHGYFGQPQVSVSSVEVPVSAFDKFRNTTSGTELRIKEAYLNFDVYNGAGFPILLNIDEVKSYVTPDGQPLIVPNAGSTTITANEIDAKGIAQAYSTNTCHVGGPALGKALSNMPSSVVFTFSTKINPAGSTTTKNFITDASTLTISNVEARVPLEFSVRGMMLKDTLDFNTSDVTFKSMELHMNVENHMPVGVTLQAYLMDEEGHQMVPAITLFKKEVNIAANTDDADIKVEANVEKLAQAKKIEVEITINTGGDPATDFVQMTRDNYIHLRIGAKTIVNIDKID